MIPYGNWQTHPSQVTATFENDDEIVPDYLSTQVDPISYDSADSEHLCEYCGHDYAYTMMEFNLLPILLCYWCSILTNDEINYELGCI